MTDNRRTPPITNAIRAQVIGAHWKATTNDLAMAVVYGIISRCRYFDFTRCDAYDLDAVRPRDLDKGDFCRMPCELRAQPVSTETMIGAPIVAVSSGTERKPALTF